jgi:hypothetical protein
MNQSLGDLLEGMRRSLREVVQPELSTDHARTQLAGVLDILGKLERMVVWSPDSIRERLDVTDAGVSFIEERLRTAGFAPPAAAPAAAVQAGTGPLLQSELVEALRRADMRLAILTDWLFEPTAALPVALRTELDAHLRATLAAALKIERRMIARADFSSMTGANS